MRYNFSLVLVKFFFVKYKILFLTQTTFMSKDFKENFKSNTDPQGSYTGKCKDAYEKPIQDADDL